MSVRKYGIDEYQHPDSKYPTILVSVGRPDCPKCGNEMRFVEKDLDSPDADHNTLFRCTEEECDGGMYISFQVDKIWNPEGDF